MRKWITTPTWRQALRIWWPEVVILLVAAILRLGWPGLTEFKLDEATLFTMAREMAQGYRWPLSGPATSQGLTNGPWSVYLLAIPALISPNPAVAILFVGALNLLAVAGTYFLARRWLGQCAARSAALLYAVSPWAIFTTRKLWVQALIPPFVLLYAIAALAFASGNRRALAVHLIALALLLQMYPATLALVPITLLLLIVKWRKISWPALLISAGIGLWIFLPYTLDQIHRGWPDIKIAVHLARSDAILDAQALQLAWMMTVGSHIHSLAGPDAFRDYLATVPNWTFLLTAEGLLIVGGAGWLIGSALRSSANPDVPERPVALFLLLWTLIPILLLTRHTIPVYPHYFLVLFPAPYLMAGAAVQALWRWARARTPSWLQSVSFVIPLALGAIALFQTLLVLSMLRFVASHPTSAFGVPLSYRITVARQVQATAMNHHVADVLLISDGDNPAWHEHPAVFDVLLEHVSRRYYVNGLTTDYALLPASPAVVLIAPGAWPGESLLANWADLTPVADVPLRAGEGHYRILLARPRTEIIQTIAPPVRWGNGAELLGYGMSDALQPGETFQLALLWHITGGETGDYHFFNHLVDAQGEHRGQKDGPSVLPRDWRPGGPFLSIFTMSLAPDLPPGRYWVRTGMYRYPDIQGVPVLDEAGQPVNDAVMLGPIDIASAAP